MPERRPGLPPTSHYPAVPSPCIRHCCLDDNDICLGCFRSIEEICAWGACDDDGKRRILGKAASRKRLHTRT